MLAQSSPWASKLLRSLAKFQALVAEGADQQSGAAAPFSRFERHLVFVSVSLCGRKPRKEPPTPPLPLHLSASCRCGSECYLREAMDMLLRVGSGDILRHH